MTVQIFTSVVNRPDFVTLQDKLFKKFLNHQYQFHVIDDSIDCNVSFKFKQICEFRNIKYYKTPEKLEHNNPSTKTGNVIQWAFDEIIKKEYSNENVLWLDSDMFLIDEFDIEHYISDCIISGTPQSRKNIEYMWNGLMFFNMPKLLKLDSEIKFNIDFVDGQHLDTGGQTYHYFKKNNILLKKIDVQHPTHFYEIELQNEKVTRGYNFELYLNSKFLHYRAATNWHSNWRGFDDPLIEKTRIFNKIIENILNE